MTQTKAQLVDLSVEGINASDLSSGTIPDARFPATLPASSGANLTSLPAANLIGTLPAISGANLTNLPSADLSNLNATNLTSGTIPDARFPATLPAISGANLTNLPPSGISNVVEDTTPELGGNLDVLTREITTSTSNGNIIFSPNGTGAVEIKGDGSSNDGVLQLNCHVNSHGVKIKSPPHSAGQSYTMILPDNQIAQDKFLKVKSITGSGATAVGQLEYADAGGGGAMEFVSKSTVSSNSTTEINLTGLDYDSVYKCIMKIAVMSGSGAPNIYLYLDGSNSANTSSIIDYVSNNAGYQQQIFQDQSYFQLYTAGYDDNYWEYEITFMTGYYGWFRTMHHPIANSYHAGWGQCWGNLNPSNAGSKRISGLSLRHQNYAGQTFQIGTQVLLYKFKES